MNTAANKKPNALKPFRKPFFRETQEGGANVWYRVLRGSGSSANEIYYVKSSRQSGQRASTYAVLSKLSAGEGDKLYVVTNFNVSSASTQNSLVFKLRKLGIFGRGRQQNGGKNN